MAFTTVRGMGFFAPAAVCTPASDAGTAAAAVVGAYGVYILGGGATVAVVVGSRVPCALPTAPAGALTAAGLGAARSKRLRQRGHQEGSPANRAPQFGHASTRSVSAPQAPKLSLKATPPHADPAVVNVVLLPL